MQSAVSLLWRWLGFLVFCLCLSTKPSPVYPRSLPRAISGESDFRVSEKAGGPSQTSPWIAALGAHGFVLVWWDQRQGRALWGQRLDIDGNPVGGNFVIADSLVTDIFTTGTKLRIDGNARGEFVVVWSARLPDSRGANIIARKFGVDANDTGRPFTVTADRRVADVYPDVSLYDDGRFVCAWERTDRSAGGASVWAQWFDANAIPEADSLLVADGGGQPAITIVDSGKVSILWVRSVFRGGVILAQFDASGRKIWGPVEASEGTSGLLPEIVPGEHGDLGATWVKLKWNGGADRADIMFRLFDANGVPRTEVLQLDDAGKSAGYFGNGPSLAHSPFNGWLVAWPDQRHSHYGSRVFEVWGQLLDDDGKTLGRRNFKVSDDSSARASTVAVFGDKGVIAWQDARRGQQDIYAKPFDFSARFSLLEPRIVNTDGDDAQQGRPTIAINAENEAVIAWVDQRSGRWRRPYFQRMENLNAMIGANETLPDIFSICDGPTVALGKSELIVGYSNFCAFACASSAVAFDFKKLTHNYFWVGGSCDEGASPAEFYIPNDSTLVAAWSGSPTGSGVMGVYTRNFLPGGNGATYPVKVNERDLLNYYYGVDIAGDSTGNFVIAWAEADSSNYAVYGQRFDSLATLAGENFRLDEGPPLVSASGARVAMAGDGRFGISWAGSSGDGLTHLWVKFFDASGEARTGAIPVNTTPGDARWIDHDIAMNAAGQSVVVWSQMNAGTWRLFGQRFDASAQPFGHNFRIGAVADEVNQIEPRLAMVNEQIYVTWADDREAQYSRNYDIWATILNFGDPLAVAPGVPIPAEISLDQNYPNPFNPETRIRYTLQSESRVKLEIFNLAGQLVARLADAVQPAGAHLVAWDGRDGSGRQVSSGIYFYRLQAGQLTRQRKMLLLR